MSKPQQERNEAKNSTQDGLKVMGWVVLLLIILTLLVGLPLTSLPF